MTHTFATLEVSRAAFDEIAEKLKAAGYGHVFVDSDTMDMHGIALTKVHEPEEDPLPMHYAIGLTSSSEKKG